MDVMGECDEVSDVLPKASRCEVPTSYAEAWAAEGVATPPPKQIEGYFEDDFALGVHGSLWRDCSVVVGMHPDQATEPMVKLAIAHGKPFAVVPCCVFPKSNTHRRLKDGTQVTTHEQFCDYLVELGEGVEGARVERAQLNSFEGRNVVVFGRGPPPA